MLIGNTGNDTLTGNTGNDRLIGNGGNDTYLFNIGDNLDTITDSAGSDVIQLGDNVDNPKLHFQGFIKQTLD